jgi:hypothetical protein
MTSIMNDQEGLAIALEEAQISYREGGVPVCAWVPILPFSLPQTPFMERGDEAT